MDIQLDHQRARDMARRLRDAVGIDQISQAKALEVLAQTLAYKNWDTLSGLLKRDASPGFVLATPVKLLVNVYACTDEGEAPAWAAILVTQEFINQLLELKRMGFDKDLDSVAVSSSEVSWAGEEDNFRSFRIRNEELHVNQFGWYFSGDPKHCSYSVETRMIDFLEFFKALSEHASTDCLTWTRDVLVYDEEGDTAGFIGQLVEDGALDESYRIEA
jgi:hypothetical protein